MNRQNPEIMSIDEMNEIKKTRGYSYEMIARKSNLPIGTVQKVLGGITKNPRHTTLCALQKAFILDANSYSIGNIVQEEAVKYGNFPTKKPGDYTVDDYEEIPEDQRYELIDGCLIKMDSPTSTHQLIAGQLHSKLLTYISANKGKCIPFVAPTDVQLDKDDKTMVVPDVFVVCDRDKITPKRIFGAPDLIIEILSDSTKSKDMKTKLAKYMNAGVREYWMIDLDKQKVIVHDFANEDISIYAFDDSIPVMIFDGKCTIDFSEIKNYIAFLL
ncbi:Uma2 family endonuclease [Butyrivibrio sp. YAB3001]|uniref:Uma2 family endonuclease n=1 Tax=Butyrivibrio sp. YAB3001 TaxID=1520812 RepID=UPI0008F62F5F|nr:Uma2 family endonuclease [Butyrivibrio sp. YAB3001]SFC20828.1 Putative restriction endonuclease [Butyrivibrio sp. YAB3001]